MKTKLRCLPMWWTTYGGLYVAIIGLIVLVVNSSDASAQGVRGVLRDLVRGTAKVADDIPVNKLDDLVTDLSKSRAAREAVDVELRKAGRFAENAGLIRGAARSEEALRLLRSTTTRLDPSVIRRVEQLDDASRDVAIVLARGGEQLSQTVPDIAMRGRLLREGGAETVAAVGMFGEDAAKAALRLDAAIRSGSVIAKQGSRAVTVADFGKVMTQYGSASWAFWKNYIRPHWKIWITGGALLTYLSNPDYFQDETGRLTEAGFQRLTGLVGEVAAGAIRGVGQGSGEAVKKITEATSETFFHENMIYAVTGALVFLGCVSLLFRRIRYWFLRPFRWLNHSPDQVSNSKS